MKSLCVYFGHASLKSNETAKEKGNRSSNMVNDKDESVTSALASKMHSLTPASGNEDDPAIGQIIDASYIKFEVRLEQLQVLIVDGFSATVDSASFIKNISALGDDSYLLRPLDVALHIQQCVYRDDSKLPAWRIFGHLPLIQSTVYDVKLEQTLQLVMSIPTPDANENKAKSGEEDEEDVTNDEENYGEDEDEMDEEEDEDELLEDFKSLAARRQSTNAAVATDDDKQEEKQEEEVQQTISLEFAFEIGEMRFTLQETVVRHFDHITMRVASFGTALQLKTYDSTYHIYLKQIECEYGLLSDVGGAKLYLISSSLTEKTDNLVDVSITQTDLLSPTLGPVHKNTLTNVNVRFGLVDFVFNPIAARNVMLFVDELKGHVTSTAANQATADKYMHTMRKVTKMIVKRIYAIQPNSIYHSDQKIKELIWSSSSSSPQSGKTTNKRGGNQQAIQLSSTAHVDIVKLKCEAKMDGFKVRLCTQTHNYLQFSVSNLTVDSVHRRDELRIDFELQSMSVRDLYPRAIFTHIVSLNDAHESNLIRVQLVIHSPPAVADNSNALARQYNKERFYFRNYLNADFFDLDVKANISKLRFVCLNKHLNLLLNIVNVFDMAATTTTTIRTTPSPPPSTQQPKSMTTNVTSISAAKEAAEVSKERFDFLYRVKLDITLNAPVIFLTPSDQLGSSQALFLDCGLITIKSQTKEILNGYWSSTASTATGNTSMTSIFKKKKLINDRLISHRLRIPPVVETQMVKLSNMEISKYNKKDKNIGEIRRIMLY